MQHAALRKLRRVGAGAVQDAHSAVGHNLLLMFDLNKRENALSLSRWVELLDDYNPQQELLVCWACARSKQMQGLHNVP